MLIITIIQCLVIAISLFSIISVAAFRSHIRKNGTAYLETYVPYKMLFASLPMLGFSILFSIGGLFLKTKTALFWISFVCVCIATTVIVMDYIHEKHTKDK